MESSIVPYKINNDIGQTNIVELWGKLSYVYKYECEGCGVIMPDCRDDIRCCLCKNPVKEDYDTIVLRQEKERYEFTQQYYIKRWEKRYLHSQCKIDKNQKLITDYFKRK